MKRQETRIFARITPKEKERQVEPSVVHILMLFGGDIHLLLIRIV